MLGNDVIDLERASQDSNWQRRGYLEKICTAEEQKLILDAQDPARQLWLLWSMKEAAYKVINRITGIRSYAPRALICREVFVQDAGARAQVLTDRYQIYIKSEFSGSRIHSSAVLEKDRLEELEIIYLDYTKDYMEAFNRSAAGFTLSRTSAGLPVITDPGSAQQWPASVSHHGRFAAVMYSGSLRSAD